MPQKYMIQLTSPHMGQDRKQAALRQYITATQRALIGAGVKVSADGVAGPETCSAYAKWKYNYGFHKDFIEPNLTGAEADWLLGVKTKTVAMKARAALRKAGNPAPPQSMGIKALNTMQSWANAGYNESPFGSNRVPELTTIARREGLSAWYQAMGWPWCAFATSLAAKIHGSATAQAGFSGKFNTLYVPAILDAARNGKHGMRVVSYDTAQPGDWVIFNFDGGVPDHIGILKNKIGNGLIRAIEGNTSSGNQGSQDDGGGVYERVRATALVQAYVRFT